MFKLIYRIAYVLFYPFYLFVTSTHLFLFRFYFWRWAQDLGIRPNMAFCFADPKRTQLTKARPLTCGSLRA